MLLAWSWHLGMHHKVLDAKPNVQLHERDTFGSSSYKALLLLQSKRIRTCFVNKHTIMACGNDLGREEEKPETGQHSERWHLSSQKERGCGKHLRIDHP